jgi:hypothetical protein
VFRTESLTHSYRLILVLNLLSSTQGSAPLKPALPSHKQSISGRLTVKIPLALLLPCGWVQSVAQFKNSNLLLYLKRRTVCASSRRRSLQRELGLRLRQEEQTAPTDSFVEFQAAFLDSQSDPDSLLVCRDLAFRTVDLQDGLLWFAYIRQEADADQRQAPSGHRASQHA